MRWFIKLISFILYNKFFKFSNGEEKMATRTKDSSRFKKTHARQRWKWCKKKTKRMKRKKRYLRQRARS